MHRWSSRVLLHACTAEVDELADHAQSRPPVVGQHLRDHTGWPAGTGRDPGGDLPGASRVTVRLERGDGTVYQRLDQFRASGRGPAARIPKGQEHRERHPITTAGAGDIDLGRCAVDGTPYLF